MAVNTRLPLPDSYQSYLRRVIQDGGSYEQIPTVQFLDQYNKIMAYNPSLVMFPSSEKPGTLYTVTPNSSSGDFTVTRTSSGSYFDRNGILRTAIVNEPRLDWNPATRQFNGVLIEPAATNLFRRSKEFENNYWTKQGLNVSESFIDNPFNESVRMLTTQATGNRRFFTSLALSANTQYSYSIFAKRGNFDQVRLDFGDNSGLEVRLLVNLASKTASLIRDDFGNASFFINNYKDDWIRTGISWTQPNTRVSTCYFQTINTQENDFVYAYGAQLETGTVATSYIPTIATTGSRSADTITKTDASSLIGQTEGTVFAEFQYVSIASFRRIIAFQAGPSATNRIAILITNTNRLQVVFRANSLIYDIATTTTPLTGLNKIALCYRSGDVRLYLNGQAISTNTNAFSFTETLSNLYIGVAEFNTVDYYNGTIKSAALYTRALPDDQAINLTAL